mmetsp:Transcript_129620/g.361158  ORF Transcript_129620/g.361158 Transcript_129620/m.361158 type:complete len:88 (-) Transcript_129620:2-265(-)
MTSDETTTGNVVTGGCGAMDGDDRKGLALAFATNGQTRQRAGLWSGRELASTTDRIQACMLRKKMQERRSPLPTGCNDHSAGKTATT